MKTNALLISLLALPLLFAAPLARALDIQPYSAAGLQQAQSAGKPVAVHFHADWCSTCKVQERVLLEIKGDPALKDVTLLVADYDAERDLKKAMNVRSQSVIVVFKGVKETARLGGETKPEKIKAGLLTAR